VNIASVSIALAAVLTLSGYSGESDAAPAAPSFDCAKAGSDAEKLVCSDAPLAQLDNELARLFALAEKDTGLSAASRAELKATQRGWIKGRDDCWKADDKKQCVLANYGSRIHELRQGYANARSPDPASVSTGPVVFKCDGIDAPLGVTFFTVEPGYAYLQNGERSVMFTAVPDAPDARYTGKGADDGDYVLVMEGKGAVFTRPATAETKCTMDEIG
jgi:uncharacterized protein